MISFIVIGKNEGWKLTKCFQSIFEFIVSNKIESYEVIYVDSKSSDDSIESAKAFSEIKIFLITGECNPAIARNIGAKESQGDILYFIDGDMEILCDFYNCVFDENNNLKYGFVSGCVINFNYDNNWNFLYKSKLRCITKERFEVISLGIFIIKKELWKLVDGMKTKFKRNQDLDLGIRLSKAGFPLLRKKEMIANHHTIPYIDNLRTWKLVLNLSELYPMVSFRDHLFYIPSIKKTIYDNYTMIFLILAIITVVITKDFIIPSIFYLAILLIKTFRLARKITINIILNFLKLFFRDIFRILAIFFFWPKRKEIIYTKIR